MLQGKNIVLGISGGIAVYKVVELLRFLVKAGADVHVIMTKNSQEFVTPLTFQTLSGNPVHTDMFSLYQEQEIGHISLADRADLFVLAPATANLVAKLAQGLADDLLTTSLLATKAPVLVVPAMNTNMYENPLYQRNEKALKNHGYHFLEPAVGALACGWEGKGKLPDPADIMTAVEALFCQKDLLGCPLLVTAGPTQEEIDPVRYLTNYSSGKMGYAIAEAAFKRGALVTLIAGPTNLSNPVGVKTVSVRSAEDMHAAVLEAYPEADVVIKAAAVADYRPCQRYEQKLKKKTADLSVPLEKTTDILAELGANKDGHILVGFAAETERLLAHAAEKLQNKNLDMIVANDVSQEGAGFDIDTNIVRFLYADGKVEELDMLTKSEVAHQLLDRVSLLWKIKQR